METIREKGSAAMLLVHLEEQDLLHVIDAPSDLKSLCGRSCWPGKWVQQKGQAVAGPFCVACLREVRK